MYQLEISTYTLGGVKAAMDLGVDRVELCDNIKEGGTTPSYGLVKAALETGFGGVFVIVRPRGGDFLYNDDEFEIIKKDIVQFRQMGVHGVVSGILLPDGNIDTLRTRELVELARPMKFTFHRAFDMCQNPQQGLEDLIGIGVDIVLTSGTENTAVEGQELLKELVEQAGDRIAILAGSGVNAGNIPLLHAATGARQYHLSAVKEVPSEMAFFNPRLSMGNVPSEEYKKLTADIAKIEQAIAAINALNGKP